MVAPVQEQPGSAHGPEPSTRQCMLIMCPHGHAPRIGSARCPLAMGWGNRKQNAKEHGQD